MSADEFDIIRTLFAPLAETAGARGLADDAALIEAIGPIVVTTDAIVEGMHFLSGDPIETIARKALRVNVSDLVGKGAKPVAALLTLIWPTTRPAEEIAIFADAFGGDLAHYGMALLGGDTTSTSGPLTVSVTAFGLPLGLRTPARADASAGDDVWLAGGDIGSAWMGLQLRTGALTIGDLKRGRDEEQARAQSDALAEGMPAYLTLPGQAFDSEAAWLMSAYLAPFVQARTAEMVARFAEGSMDVSDGLMADAAKLAHASGVALHLEANAIPLTIAAERWLSHGGDFRKLITGGDDYVALFTAPPEARDSILGADPDAALRISRIGRVEEGAGVRIVDAGGTPIPIDIGGYAHRLGR